MLGPANMSVFWDWRNQLPFLILTSSFRMSLSSQRLQIKIDAMTKALVYLVDIAVAEAADTIVAEQKSLAPKLTGALAASIKKTKTGPMKYRISAGGLLTLKEVRQGSHSS